MVFGAALALMDGSSCCACPAWSGPARRHIRKADAKAKENLKLQNIQQIQLFMRKRRGGTTKAPPPNVDNLTTLSTFVEAAHAVG
jgi:hypothetical protein